METHKAWSLSEGISANVANLYKELLMKELVEQRQDIVSNWSSYNTIVLSTFSLPLTVPSEHINDVYYFTVTI